MAQFLLLMRGGDWNALTPEEMEAETKRYFDWTDQLRNEGRLISSEQLGEGGNVVRQRDGALIVDGPFVETKESIGGFYLITATDADEAAEVAKGCPIFRYGGTVDVRPILSY
jgi:hypothetical protein